MNYFRQEEFKCKCGKCDGGAMNPEFLAKLNQARHLAKVPFIITSGYRCSAHNKAVGGKPNSAHTRGLAADIKFDNGTQAFAILHGLLAAGFVRVGYNQKHGFFHVDSDPTLPQQVFFDYQELT